MEPAIVLISDDEDQNVYDKKQLQSVVVISDDDDEVNLVEVEGLESVVVISDDDEDDINNLNGEESKSEHNVKYNESNNRNDVEKSNISDERVDCVHEGSNDLQELSLDECKSYLRWHELRVCGTKEECIQRIKEHERLKCGKAEALYPISSFSINCTGDACKGDNVLFEQLIMEGVNIVGKRIIAGRILKESYSASSLHTFSVEVLWSKGPKILNPLSLLLLKGRIFYKFGTYRQPWDDEAERLKVLAEKHSRGDAARKKWKLRRLKFAFNTNKRATRLKVAHCGPSQSKHPTQMDEQKLANQRPGCHHNFDRPLKWFKSLYIRSSFSIDCTDDACKGDVVLFKRNRYERGKIVRKKRTIVGRIVEETYGASDKQHTFTVEVLWTKPATVKLSPTSTLQVQDLELYQFGTLRQPWEDEAKRPKSLTKKHQQVLATGQKRKLRETDIASNNNRGPKRQKKKTRSQKKALKRSARKMLHPDPFQWSFPKGPFQWSFPNLNPNLILDPNLKPQAKPDLKPNSTQDTNSSPNPNSTQDTNSSPNSTQATIASPNPNPNPNPNPCPNSTQDTNSSRNPNPNPNQGTNSSQNPNSTQATIACPNPNSTQATIACPNPYPNSNQDTNPSMNTNPNSTQDTNSSPNSGNLNPNPNQSKQTTKKNKRKHAKRQGHVHVKEGTSIQKRKTRRLKKKKLKRKTQPNLNPKSNLKPKGNPNPKPKGNPNPNPNSNRKTNLSPNLKPKPNLSPVSNSKRETNQYRDVYVDDHLQEPSSSSYYDRTLLSNQSTPGLPPNQAPLGFLPDQPPMQFLPNQQHTGFYPYHQHFGFFPDQQPFVFPPNQQHFTFHSNQQPFMFPPNQQQGPLLTHSGYAGQWRPNDAFYQPSYYSDYNMLTANQSWMYQHRR